MKTIRLAAATLLAVGTITAGSTSAATAASAPAPAPAPAQAAPAEATALAARNYYGAISLNVRNAAVGYSYNFLTRSKAQSAARAQCQKYRDKKYCKNTVWVRNGCAAVAIRLRSNGTLRNYGWATARSKNTAIARAKKEAGKGSKMRAWVCTTR